MKPKTILLPLDGTNFSRQIIYEVIDLFDPASTTILLLRVGEPVHGLIGLPPRPVAVGWLGSVYERPRDLEYARHPIFDTQAEASERAALERELSDEALELRTAGFTVAVEATFGNPADEIVACAERRHANLIAMATSGRAGLRGLLLGSVAEEVLRQTSLPVLMVRPLDEGGEW